MNFYLFQNFSSLRVVKALQHMKETHQSEEYFSIFPQLMEFSKERPFSGTTMQEFLIEQFLCSAFDSTAITMSSNALYYSWDINQFYSFAFSDWNKLCQSVGVFPPPAGKKQMLAPTSDYSRRLLKMANSPDAETFAELVKEFFLCYSCVMEAKYSVFQWKNSKLVGVDFPDSITFDQLSGLDYQKDMLRQNTSAFVQGKPCNDILLVGGSGNGKSSCVKATINEFAPQGLRLVEVAKEELSTLSDLMRQLRNFRNPTIIFIDDLSFEVADSTYSELKVTLDGQVEARPAHLKIYATSNRRHLIHESWNDRNSEDELHKNDILSEKLSLSERFGIHLFFGLLDQQEYFSIVELILSQGGIAMTDSIAVQAASWATAHNGRSGRTAKQFANYYMTLQENAQKEALL